MLTWKMAVNHSLYEFFQVSHKTCEDLLESEDESEEEAAEVVQKENINDISALRGRINFCDCNIKMVLCTVRTAWKQISTIVILQDARTSEPQTYKNIPKAEIIIQPQRRML